MTPTICDRQMICNRWAVHVQVPYEGWCLRWFPGPCPDPEARVVPGLFCPRCRRDNADALRAIGMGYPRNRAEHTAELWDNATPEERRELEAGRESRVKA